MRPLKLEAVVHASDARTAIIQHDARDLPLPDDSVDLIITSPPYFAFRSYRDDDGHMPGQIGDEPTLAEFLDALDECMVEWWRVLKLTGSVWINLGDKWSGSGGHNNSGVGAPRERGPKRYVKDSGSIRHKSLIGIPWRFAIRQIDVGWILRSEVIWDKPNGIPNGAKDRVRGAHEHWFHFVKASKYFSATHELREHGGRVPSDVWRVNIEPLRVPKDVKEDLDLPSHFAAFPQEFPRRIVLGWSPKEVCFECKLPRSAIVERTLHDDVKTPPLSVSGTDEAIHNHRHGMKGSSLLSKKTYEVVGYECDCEEPTAKTTPGVVLDPFGGSGTVVGVARILGRVGINNDLSDAYNRLAEWRIWESGHFEKSEQKTWELRQEKLL